MNAHAPETGPKSIKAEAVPGQGQRKIPKKITETYLHNSGLYYLQRFAASTGHFQTVMKRKIDRSCRHHADQDRAACLAMLERMIVKFQSLGLLDDETYTQAAVATLRRRGLSERAILSRMQAKNVPAENVRAALRRYNAENSMKDDESEMAAALRLAKKKRVGPYAGDKPCDRNKALAAFARAGFSFEIARKILDLGADEGEGINAFPD